MLDEADPFFIIIPDIRHAFRKRVFGGAGGGFHAGFGSGRRWLRVAQHDRIGVRIHHNSVSGFKQINTLSTTKTVPPLQEIFMMNFMHHERTSGCVLKSLCVWGFRVLPSLRPLGGVVDDSEAGRGFSPLMTHVDFDQRLSENTGWRYAANCFTPTSCRALRRDADGKVVQGKSRSERTHSFSIF